MTGTRYPLSSNHPNGIDSRTQEWRDLGEAGTRVVVSSDVPQRTVCFGVMMSFDTGTSDSAQGHSGTGAFALTVEASKHD